MHSQIARGLLMMIVLATTAIRATAGANAGGVAWASWDRAGAVTSISTADAQSPILYVHLGNASEVEQLAISITTFPFDSVASCYRFLAPSLASNRDSTCGLSSPVPTSAIFQGDAGYDWSISFPTGLTQRSCVAYYLTTHPCPSPNRVSFVLKSVVVVDASGQIDTLSIAGGATIEPPPAIDRVFPQRLQSGVNSRLEISGRHFRERPTVTLIRGEDRIPTTDVAIVDSTTVVANTAPLTPLSGSFDLLLTMPDSTGFIMPNAITIETAAASAVNKPTDEANGYLRLNIHAHGPSYGLWEQGISVAGYPDHLDTPYLIATQTDGDTIGLFLSQSKDGVAISYDSSWPQPGFVQYAPPPDRAFSSVGLLSVTADALAGAGQFDNADDPWLGLITHHASGDSVIVDLRVGSQIRNRLSGVEPACGSSACFTSPLTDPLCHQVFSGPIAAEQCFYDVQEIALPSSARASALKYLELRQRPIFRNPPCSDGATYLFGLSLWNRYRIANSLNVPVQLQRQTDNGSTPYGGYRHGAIIVGSDRTMAAQGCLVACASMANAYYGVACTPIQLNAWLQDNKGFGRVNVGRVTSVTGPGFVGDTVLVAFRVPGAVRGSHFLIEADKVQYAPRAEVQIVVDNGATGRGIITKHFGGAPISSGSNGWVYSEMIGRKASRGFSNGVWEFSSLGAGSSTPARAESLLAGNLPVIIHTRLNSNNVPRHWVLAEGREPAFTSPTLARGTYRVCDPYYEANGAPVSRLIEVPLNNMFKEARVCRPLTGGSSPGSLSNPADTSKTLWLTLQGPARVEVVAPSGQWVVFDAAKDEYSTNMGAETYRRISVPDTDESGAPVELIDRIAIPEPAEGNYSISVHGEAAGSYLLQISDLDLAFGDNCSVIEGETASGSSAYYQVAYSAATGLGPAETVDVQPELPEERLNLAISPNPVSHFAQVSFTLRKEGQVRIEVFDLTGRAVKRLVSGTFPAGPGTVLWDCTDVEGGMYFVRMSAESRHLTKRMVILQ